VDETLSRRIEYAAVNRRRHSSRVYALRTLGAILVALATHGCAAHAAGATGSDVKVAPAAAPSAPEAEAARQKIVDEVTVALRSEDFKEAAAVVERARQLSPPLRPSAKFLAYFDATVHAYQGDFRGAVKVMEDHIATVGPTAMDAFSFHDAMIALRTADGDLLGALVECEEMTRAGALGTWTSSPDRMTLVRLKEHWHRAYLLRMIAQTLVGAERQAFIRYAEAARQDYVALAAPLKTLDDSIAVLNAYFAYCDGDQVKMRDEARRVNVVADDDVEDLYLVQLAFDGAGDHEAAASVRSRMTALKFVTVLTPVFVAWMRADQAPPDQPRQFSPKNPTGARPAVRS
jgi:hypothetical protein